MALEYEEENLDSDETMFTVKADSSDIQKLRNVSWKGGVFHEGSYFWSSIPWIRKPVYNDYREVISSPLRRVTSQVESALEDLERIYFKDWKSLVVGNFKPNTPQYFVAELEREGKLILVNTEGYDYPRYVCYLPDSLFL